MLHVKNKKTIAFVATIFIAALLVSAFAVAQILHTVDIDSYTAQAQKDFQNAKTLVEQIRNVTLPNNVHLYVITKQDAVDRWGTTSANANLALIQRQENIYKTLFIINETDSLYQATVDWTANWGAATLGNDIYVIKENFDPFNLPDAEATFVHELTHVWQPNLPYATTFDADKARTALIEGDASYMGDYFIENYGNDAVATEDSMMMVNNIPVFLLNNPALNAIHPMPDSIWQLNFFPYDKGKIFVNALHDSGGWQTVNDAYQNMPATTAQILHPDMYFENQTAQPVNSPTLAEDNWSQITNSYNHKSDRLGEYFIQVMLDRWLNQTKAEQSAAGWLGDNFTYYQRDSDYLFTWNIQWSSNCDASDFYVTFHDMANAAGATDYGSCNWSMNGRYLSIMWDQSQNTTLIAGSNVQAATQEGYFSWK